MSTHEVIQVAVPCPSCGNRNRKARRACRSCDHKGLVLKNLPVGVLPAAVDKVADAKAAES